MEKHSRGTLDTAAGFTLVELLIVVALMITLSGFSALYLMQAKKAANEASAIGTLKAVNSGQTAYATSCGKGHYAATLVTLVTGQFLAPEANLSPKSGYAFVQAPGATDGPTDCTGATSKTSFYVTGTPVSVVSGTRAFATNQNGSIWQDTSGVPPVEPFVIAGTVSPLNAR